MHSSLSISDTSVNLFDTLTELWILNTFWISHSFSVFPLPLSFSPLLSISHFLLWSLILIVSVTGGQKPGLLKHISGCVCGEYFRRHLAGKPANWWMKAALTGGGTPDRLAGRDGAEKRRGKKLVRSTWELEQAYLLSLVRRRFIFPPLQNRLTQWLPRDLLRPSSLN